MKRHLLNVSVCVAATIAGAVLWEHAPLAFAQAQNRPATVNWALHNLDLAGRATRRSIRSTASNVKTLAPRWLFQHGVIDGVSNQTTPIIVDGIDVRDRSARQRLRASTPPTAICSGATTSRNLIGGGAREGYVFRNRGVVLRRRRGLHGGAARSCSRSTRRPASRSRRSARTARRA